MSSRLSAVVALAGFALAAVGFALVDVPMSWECAGSCTTVAGESGTTIAVVAATAGLAIGALAALRWLGAQRPRRRDRG